MLWDSPRPLCNHQLARLDWKLAIKTTEYKWYIVFITSVKDATFLSVSIHSMGRPYQILDLILLKMAD